MDDTQVMTRTQEMSGTAAVRSTTPRTKGQGAWMQLLSENTAWSAEQAGDVATLLARGETMGLLDRHGGAWEPSDLGPGLGALVKSLDKAGALAHRFTQLASGWAADQTRLLEALMEVTESNAFPESEWAPLRHHLGDDLLAEVIGVSEASLRRYAAGSRQTPDLVGERLHWLALVVADLRGAYNDRGVRRWFRRPRTLLGGESPVQVLQGGLDPDSPRAAEVRALAHALVAPGAA